MYNHGCNKKQGLIEMFYLNTIEQVFLLVEQLDQLVVCLTYSRLLTGIPKLAVFQNLRWKLNKTSLCLTYAGSNYSQFSIAYSYSFHLSNKT